MIYNYSTPEGGGGCFSGLSVSYIYRLPLCLWGTLILIGRLYLVRYAQSELRDDTQTYERADSNDRQPSNKNKLPFWFEWLYIYIFTFYIYASLYIGKLLSALYSDPLIIYRFNFILYIDYFRPISISIVY